MVDKDNKPVTCPICGGGDFFPHERKGKQMLKCIKCGKEHKMEDIFKPVDCKEGECKL